MLINNKAARKNRALRKAQRQDTRMNRDRHLERGSVLKGNIGKVVRLSSEVLVGDVCPEFKPISVNMSAEELISMLERSQLTGNSGSGFPTAEKIKTFLSSDTDKKYIVINGAECEPGLLNDAWLMRNRMTDICFGAEVLRKALSPDRMILATRGKAEYKVDTKLEWVKLPYQYPMGEEHILVSQALGLSFSCRDIPAEKGVLVLNVQTVFQIGRIAANNYDGGHFVTLANLRTGDARVAYVHTGTNVVKLLREAFPESGADCYFGGGVGRAEKARNGDVFNNTTSFASIVDEMSIPKENKCKKCGACTKKCPMGIKVKDIVLTRQKDIKADISSFRADQCIYCGLCTYHCPSGIDPIGYIIH